MSFSINAKTCTLKYNTLENSDVILRNNTKYVIPIYQRPYSWSEDQIRQLITDIFASYHTSNGNVAEEPVFIGTMQFSPKDSGEREVIDGQQRLSTFLLLLKVLRQQFPENEELKDLPLDWLHTRVNNGQQQQYLEEALKSDYNSKDNPLNPYLANALLIKSILEEHIHAEAPEGEQGHRVAFQPEGFVKYLLGNVYFVVIETRAGLAKTLQIFNAINTTGLDLNGGDIFKIRMYEYLRDKKGETETAFERIGQLYGQIEENNRKLGHSPSNIHEILRIYQYILIAKYALPPTLYTYGVDTFFERLFETLLNVRAWELFKGNVTKLELSLADIERIIEVRYEWENTVYPSAEDAAAMHSIWDSRYGGYWYLVIIFLYEFKGEPNLWNKLFEFTRQLSKLYMIYTIRFDKQIKEMHQFTQKLMQVILHKSSEEVTAEVNEKIGKLEAHKYWYDLEEILNGEITGNRARKNTICRISALMEEDYRSTDKEMVKSVSEKLFGGLFDIEHIQPYHHCEEDQREIIWREWKEEINSIGNLIILEQSLNRSISNSPYPVKIQRYADSSYAIVKNHTSTYPDWNLQKCKERKQKEVQKIINYLFSK